MNTECFAVPGETIIDTINSTTGLTHYYSKTLEECRAEYAGRNVERMTLDAFCASKAARQDTPIEWWATTEETFWSMMEVLPPYAHVSGIVSAFLVGEPWDHHAITGEPRCDAFARHGEKYLAGSRPMTRREFNLEIAKLQVSAEAMAESVTP